MNVFTPEDSVTDSKWPVRRELKDEEFKKMISEYHGYSVPDWYIENRPIDHWHAVARRNKFMREINSLLEEGKYDEAREHTESLSNKEYVGTTATGLKIKYSELKEKAMQPLDKLRSKKDEGNKEITDIYDQTLQKLGLGPEVDGEIEELMEEIEDWK